MEHCVDSHSCYFIDGVKTMMEWVTNTRNRLTQVRPPLSLWGLLQYAFIEKNYCWNRVSFYVKVHSMENSSTLELKHVKSRQHADATYSACSC